MKVLEKNLRSILGTKSLVVPAFQRRYAWKERNFIQLWEGVTELLDGTRKQHFMGAVVFQMEGNTHLTVIDGQQRLITFTIVLKVLHDLARNYPPTNAERIRKLFYRGGKYSLRPSLDDRSAFDLMLESPESLRKTVRDHRGFKDCYDFFTTQVRQYVENSPGHKSKRFADILTALTERMVFVEILLAGEDDTHTIFETINYSGVPLTAADLAQNLVLSKAKNDEEQGRLHKQYWRPLQHQLNGSVTEGSNVHRKAEVQKILPEFLRAALVVETGHYISASDLFPKLRIYFTKRTELEEHLSTLLEHVEEFCKFIKPELETRKKVQGQLIRLLELKMTTYYPVLLVLFRASKRNVGFGAIELVSAMRYIESFIVRRAFNSKVSRDLPKTFAKIAISLHSNESDANLLNQLSGLLINNGWPTDEVFKPSFLATPIYATAPATARFALLSLEHVGNNANERRLDKSIHIEHVFPQSPKQGDWQPKDLSELKKRLHVMGNLTLSERTNNQTLSNQGFEEKQKGKKGYVHSPYWLSKTLKRYTQWTAVEVDKRGKLLLREALKLWPFPG